MLAVQSEVNQSVLDITLQVFGNLDNIVSVASSNGLSLSSIVLSPTYISYVHTVPVTSAANYLRINDIKVVTGDEKLSPLVLTDETSGGRKIDFPVVQPRANEYQPVPNQNAIDVALQLGGSLDNLVEFCSQNQTLLTTTDFPASYCQYQPAANTAATYFQLNEAYVVTGGEPLSPLVVTYETSGGRKIDFPVVQPRVNEYQPRYGQSMIDIALQLTGSLDSLVTLCGQNQSLVTADNVAGYFQYQQATRATSTAATYFHLNDRYVVTMDNEQGLSIIQTEFESTEYQGEEYA